MYLTVCFFGFKILFVVLMDVLFYSCLTERKCWLSGLFGLCGCGCVLSCVPLLLGMNVLCLFICPCVIGCAVWWFLSVVVLLWARWSFIERIFVCSGRWKSIVNLMMGIVSAILFFVKGVWIWKEFCSLWFGFSFGRYCCGFISLDWFMNVGSGKCI